MGGSRVLLLQNSISPDGEYLQDDLFERDAPGIRRRMGDESFVGIPIKDTAFHEVGARRSRGEVVHAGQRAPDRAARMAEDGRRQVIYARSNHGRWCLVGNRRLRRLHRERSWQPLDIETLRATAGLIGVAIAHDQTVSALRDSERHFRGILESARDAIVTSDDQGIIVEFNPAAEAMFGIARDQAVGTKARDLIIPQRHGAAHDLGTAHYPSTGSSQILNQRIEVTAARGDDEFPAELTVTSTRVGGRVLFTAHIRDLTQQKEAAREIARQRERLYQSEKMSALGSLLAGVAHASTIRCRLSSDRC
jgi:PAS domain S-box-containing protein